MGGSCGVDVGPGKGSYGTGEGHGVDAGTREGMRGHSGDQGL